MNENPDTLSEECFSEIAKIEVRENHPTSICVHTFGQKESYRIWPTSYFLETRFIGEGETEQGAWISAAEALKEKETK